MGDPMNTIKIQCAQRGADRSLTRTDVSMLEISKPYRTVDQAVVRKGDAKRTRDELRVLVLYCYAQAAKAETVELRLARLQYADELDAQYRATR